MNRAAFQAYEDLCERRYQSAFEDHDDDAVEGACRECKGEGIIGHWVRDMPKNRFVRSICDACDGTGDQKDADWKIDNAEAADNIARAALTRRCEGDGDLVDEMCAFIAADHAGLTADCEGFIAFLIRTNHPIWSVAFETAYSELRRAV